MEKNYKKKNGIRNNFLWNGVQINRKELTCFNNKIEDLKQQQSQVRFNLRPEFQRMKIKLERFHKTHLLAEL